MISDENDEIDGGGLGDGDGGDVGGEVSTFVPSVKSSVAPKPAGGASGGTEGGSGGGGAKRPSVEVRGTNDGGEVKIKGQSAEDGGDGETEEFYTGNCQTCGMWIESIQLGVSGDSNTFTCPNCGTENNITRK